MLLENDASGVGRDRIKCGSCKSEYYPRVIPEGLNYDYSCPVCGHGKFQEGYVKKGKQILHD